MKRLLTRALLATAAAALLSASPALAQQSPPVSVEACSADAGLPALQFVNPFGVAQDQAAVPPMLMIAFKNTAAHPLSTVDFGVVRGGKVIAVVRDAGSFANSAVIMHAFHLPSIMQSEESVTCIPLAAKYADGSSWMSKPRL